MALTDPLGDMLTRIRNGQQAKKDSVVSPASKLRARVLDVLQREGYIRGYSEETLGNHPGLRIELKYFEGQPAIKHVARVSKPGRRVYSGSKELPVIRNGQRARKDSVLSPSSKLRVRVLDVLQREGYIRGYSEEQMGPAAGVRIELKYFEGQPAIKHVARVSKPGRRIYSGSQDLPRVMNGLGITIVSTPRGVLSDAEAREQNVGGEVLAEVF